VPLRKPWPRFKSRVGVERLKAETKRRFGYKPHDWQLEAALKVLEGNDGVVVAGTGKGKTMVFALLGLAVQLSKTKGYYIIVSPLKALECDQVRTVLNEERLVDRPDGDRLHERKRQTSGLQLSTRIRRGRTFQTPCMRTKGCT
jgi:ATP-dependent helicase YprA (DUF1998 family)